MRAAVYESGARPLRVALDELEPARRPTLEQYLGAIPRQAFFRPRVGDYVPLIPLGPTSSGPECWAHQEPECLLSGSRLTTNAREMWKDGRGFNKKRCRCLRWAVPRVGAPEFGGGGVG